MSVTYVSDKKYTNETLVCAFEYLVPSKAANNRVRQDFELPNVRTLTRLISKVKTIDDSSFIKHIFTCLCDMRKRTCFLPLRQHCNITVE